MKKISLLLAILLMVSFGVSGAAADTSFEIVTSVSDVSQVRVGDANKNPSSVSTFESIGEIEQITISNVDGIGLTHPLGVYAMTNVSGTYTVSTTATPLRIGEEGFILKYTVTVDSTDYVVDSAAGTSITFISSFSQSSGLSFAKQNFDVTVAATDLEAAESGDYSSTWTIELIKD